MKHNGNTVSMMISFAFASYFAGVHFKILLETLPNTLTVLFPRYAE